MSHLKFILYYCLWYTLFLAFVEITAKLVTIKSKKLFLKKDERNYSSKLVIMICNSSLKNKQKKNKKQKQKELKKEK